MELKRCGLSAQTLNALNKKKILTTEQYMSIAPKGCDDYSTISTLHNSTNRKVLLVGTINSYEVHNTSKPPRITVKLTEKDTSTYFQVVWFSQNYRENQIKYLLGAEVCVAGTVTYSPLFGYSVTNPDHFVRATDFEKRPYPKYPKISGVSAEMQTKLYKTFSAYISEKLEPGVLAKSGIDDIQTTNRMLHFPHSIQEYENAVSQLRFRDMLYFASRTLDADASIRMERLNNARLADAYLSILPFKFTDGQRKAADTIRSSLASGFATKSLVQGDVGCGKTAVAIYSCLYVIGNGKQAVIMAPTNVLAKQHFDEISRIAVRLNALGFNIQPEFLSGGMSAKEKKAAQKRISDGTSNFIVGTHSVFTDCYIYKDLALVVVDEEHRFGVKQREALAERSRNGLHQILMSATPIPRTLAGALYSESTNIIDIKTLPNGRKPVQTAITTSDSAVFRFMSKQLVLGRQAYVVCPLIENEDEDGGKGSVTEVVARYRAALGDEVKIEAAHGKLKKQELEDVLERFHSGQTQILVATTVIEVGVNNPNASMIVIENAELFGLATLHQLRGRVGRGSYDAYCVLKSEDKDNPRLAILTSTTDGFVIAEEDIKLRGTGNLIGLEQTGFDRYVSMSMAYPDEYARAKKVAKWALSQGLTNMLRTDEETGA